jgi:hypothetical protein
MSNSARSSKESQGFEGNTKPQISPAKHWVFTHNNPTEEDITMWKEKPMDPNVKLLVCQLEQGESGTVHVQGTISFETKVRPFHKGSSNKIHWEKRKGKQQEACMYCLKEPTGTHEHPMGYFKIVYGWRPPVVVKTIKPNKWWQKSILNIIAMDPDDRTIHWFWGEGGIGKTSMAKYLSVHHGAIPLNGKGADMRNGVCDYVKTNGHTPDIVVIPIPKSFDCDYLSYEGIETIKDMYFYSGKYEGGVVVGNSPHVIVLCNEKPCLERMSKDRWSITKID